MQCNNIRNAQTKTFNIKDNGNFDHWPYLNLGLAK